VNVVPKPIKAQIEMRVALGDELKQDVPLINLLDRDI
jgi:hypothetical protein